ncbi:hypothetical protein KA977_05015 [Candidatus Dependentiae bacterium]|nr:hypothetical protein [Candidatus Dependentiae bacterium]
MILSEKWIVLKINLIFICLILIILSGCGDYKKTPAFPVIQINNLYDTYTFVNNVSYYHLNIYYNGTDYINVSIDSIPSFVSYDSSQKIFTISPVVTDTGEFVVEFTVRNSVKSAIAAGSFKIDVFNPASYSVSPSEWRNKVMYLVMIDRFNDGDTAINQLNAGDMFDPADKGKIHGGDIQGIIDKLDYLQNLGITALWITPILKNKPSYHGYHILDFKEIDPHFGNIEKYKELVSEAHKRGISVIFDAIVNHSADLISNYENKYDWNYTQGYTLKYSDESLKHLPSYLANLDYFHNYGNIGSGWDDPIEGVKGDFFGLDDIKTEHPEVQKILSYIYMWWILKTDCDGFRIDTTKHVDFSFWEHFLPYIKSECSKIGKTNFFIFGEVWCDTDDEKVGKYTGTKNNPDKYLFESLTYFPMKTTIIDVFKNFGATNLITQRRANINYYDTSAQDKLVTFFDNHDLDRFNSKKTDEYNYIQNIEGYDTQLKLAYLFMASYPGIPCIYYGTEQGFDGYKLSVSYGDGYVREDMWNGLFEFGPSSGDNFDTGHNIYNFIKIVNNKFSDSSYSFIKTGLFAELQSEDTCGIYAFSRYSNDSEAIIIFNTSSSTKNNVPLNLKLNYTDGTLLTNIFDSTDTLVVVSNSVAATLNGLSYKIYSR